MTSTVKKIFIARAIVDNPKLLLIENFFEYFDHQTKREFIEFEQ